MLTPHAHAHKRKKVTRSHRVNKPPSHCSNCRSACKLGTRPSPPHGRARPVQPSASWTPGNHAAAPTKDPSPTTPAARTNPEAGTEPIADPRPWTTPPWANSHRSRNPSHFACGTADNGATPEPFARPIEAMRGLPDLQSPRPHHRHHGSRICAAGSRVLVEPPPGSRSPVFSGSPAWTSRQTGKLRMRR